ncbi:MAG: phosphoribosylglycinamide formyltransferase [Rhodospirillales bacterium RIFCSPLOWO2_12_FULL_58_28]|nr:MAG: phosphoribosylglycinamide formyltransferase [Rhodospirillales bacterium RIFCSPLOWO2_02_FULL_58_16]OHC78693.1 MAG: phosphoribosylglycinamide formyltransferase [Rhodospirillales bacterium RIFCSPLOWO2_12_FULL_58_28]
MAKLRVGVLISGRGSNMRALIDAASAPDYPAEIVLVVSNVPGAGGLEYAKSAGIAVAVVNHKEFATREAFEEAVCRKLQEAEAELVCLAGFMRVLTEGMARRWRDRLINIHPSLLPAFTGLHVQERAVETGVRFSGCTVHFVRPAMDDGPIIAQACVPVFQSDSADDLTARILIQEHRIYPLAVKLIAEGRVRVVNERVTIDGADEADGVLLNPQP